MGIESRTFLQCLQRRVAASGRQFFDLRFVLREQRPNQRLAGDFGRHQLRIVAGRGATIPTNNGECERAQ